MTDDRQARDPVGPLDAGPRYVEVPPSRTTAVLTVAHNVLLRLALGGAAAFAVGLVAMIALDEGAIPVPGPWLRLDAFGRVFIGMVFFAGCGLPALLMWILSLPRSLAFRRDIQRYAADGGDGVPVAAQRDRANGVGERVATAGFVTGLTGGILVVVCGIATAMVDGDARGIGLMFTGGAAGITLLGWLLGAWGTGERVAPRGGSVDYTEREVSQADRAVQLRAAAQRAARVTAAAPLPRSRGPQTVPGRIYLVGGVAAGAAVVTLFIPVFLRQPCKNCDAVYYADPVEWVIHSGLALSVACTALAVLAFSVGPILEALLAHRKRSELRRLAALPTSGTSRPDDAVLHAQLTDITPLRVAATLLAIWGSGFVWFALAARIEAEANHPPFVDLPWAAVLRIGVALLAGLVFIEWLAQREHHETADLLRRTWPVADPPPAAQAHRRA
ncbi:MAG: hypothetical protein QM713_10205 [Arachnia sp.]